MKFEARRLTPTHFRTPGNTEKGKLDPQIGNIRRCEVWVGAVTLLPLIKAASEHFNREFAVGVAEERQGCPGSSLLGVSAVEYDQLGPGLVQLLLEAVHFSCELVRWDIDAAADMPADVVVATDVYDLDSSAQAVSVSLAQPLAQVDRVHVLDIRDGIAHFWRCWWCYYFASALVLVSGGAA